MKWTDSLINKVIFQDNSILIAEFFFVLFILNFKREFLILAGQLL